ncbi:MAG: hypothetical protein K2M96_00295 [Prevotella sp.]|nr:hypothetical protein [Prevotella sp.]
MENKNPLEEVRIAVLEGQLLSNVLGVENEITQMGISDELLEICNALDDYYGINRRQEPDAAEATGVYRIKSPLFMENIMESDYYRMNKFNKTMSLLEQVKEPLKSMKEKLSEEDPVYLNLSSAIVSIALRDVVSVINSYEKPTSFYDMRQPRFLNHSLIGAGLIVFDKLNSFDMSKECFDCYEANRKAIVYMSDELQALVEKILHPARNNSGCFVLTLIVSTSIMACFGMFIVLFVGLL